MVERQGGGNAAGVVRVNNPASATEPSYAFRGGVSCGGALGRVRARGGIGGCPVSGGRGWGWGLCCRPRGLAGTGKFTFLTFPNVIARVGGVGMGWGAFARLGWLGAGKFYFPNVS